MSNHYVRTNEAGVIILSFSDAFAEPLETDLLVAEEAGRHFNPELMNERGQYLYRWDGEIVPISQAELDAEWTTRPVQLSEIAEIRVMLGDLILGGL